MDQGYFTKFDRSHCLREVSRQGEDCESPGSPGGASKDGMFGSAPSAAGEKQSELTRPPALSFTSCSFGVRVSVCVCVCVCVPALRSREKEA